MNSTKTTTAGLKSDDSMKTVPATAGTAAKPAACATTPGKTEACPNTHDGKLVSISGNKLVMSSHEGKEYSHTVAPDARVCCDGKTCKTEDLKVGSKIRLTTNANDKHVAAKIESLNKHTEFAPMK